MPLFHGCILFMVALCVQFSSHRRPFAPGPFSLLVQGFPLFSGGPGSSARAWLEDSGWRASGCGDKALPGLAACLKSPWGMRLQSWAVPVIVPFGHVLPNLRPPALPFPEMEGRVLCMGGEWSWLLYFSVDSLKVRPRALALPWLCLSRWLCVTALHPSCV